MRQLSPKYAEYVRHRVAGKACVQAALAAGFSRGYARHAAEKLDRHPLIKIELDAHRERLREKTGYDAEQAMAELDDSILFARKTENAGAVAKLVELKMKLHGLLIERLDQRVGGGNFQIIIEGIDRPAPAAPIPLDAPLPRVAGPSADETLEREFGGRRGGDA